MLFLVFKLLQIPCPLQCCTGLLLCFSNLLQIPRLLRCCTDLASCCSKLQLIPFVHCGAAQIWHCAAQSCSLFLLFIAVLHRSGIVLLKAAADSFCSLRCCTDLASCCSKLQLIPFVHCGAAQIWHRAAQSCREAALSDWQCGRDGGVSQRKEHSIVATASQHDGQGTDTLV